MSNKDTKLTEKQLAFIDYYLETLNAREAYKRAYGTKNNNTADSNASKLLSNTKVKKIIDERLAEIASKRIAKVEEVQQFLTSCMRGERHTKEEFDFIIGKCDKYEKHCIENNIPNGVATATISQIRKLYDYNIMHNTFLEESADAC